MEFLWFTKCSIVSSNALIRCTAVYKYQAAYFKKCDVFRKYKYVNILYNAWYQSFHVFCRSHVSLQNVKRFQITAFDGFHRFCSNMSCLIYANCIVHMCALELSGLHVASFWKPDFLSFPEICVLTWQLSSFLSGYLPTNAPLNLCLLTFRPLQDQKHVQTCPNYWQRHFLCQCFLALEPRRHRITPKLTPTILRGPLSQMEWPLLLVLQMLLSFREDNWRQRSLLLRQASGNGVGSSLETCAIQALPPPDVWKQGEGKHFKQNFREKLDLFEWWLQDRL